MARLVGTTNVDITVTWESNTGSFQQRRDLPTRIQVPEDDVEHLTRYARVAV